MEALEFTLRGGSQRLDKFLVSCLPDLSRSRLQALIRDGQVKINGQTAAKSGTLVEDGQVVQIYLPEPAPAGLQPEKYPLDILYEDGNVIVVNKPAGMVVHPSAGHASGTLVNAALAHAPDLTGIGGEIRPGVVHRLDKDTSGIILLAKNDAAHRWLQAQFKQRQVEKIYLALVDGKPPTPKGRIEAPIGRDPKNRQKMAVVPPEKGREAVSDFFTVENFSAHTLLQVHPLTGRTHQIRLHLAFLKCPVAGDTVYGRKRASIPVRRHFLHAWRLTICLPGEKTERTFEAPLPPELQEVLSQLRGR